MYKLCVYCRTFKFKNEAPGMSCAGRKVKLPKLYTPSEILSKLVSGDMSLSKYFLWTTVKGKQYKLHGFINIQVNNFHI